MPEVAGGEAPIAVSAAYLLELLQRSEELGELKAVLYTLYLAARRGTRAVSLDDLLAPPVTRALVGRNSPEPAELRLRQSLDRAVAAGSLLRLTAGSRGRQRMYFLPATNDNRELVDAVRASEPRAVRELGLPEDADVTIYRPNVFAFYEQHIGPLTPLVAEQLRDAERSYPRAWIEDAILTAVQYNRRSWKYVEAILGRWEAAGGPG